jgi:hypothetical protein
MYGMDQPMPYKTTPGWHIFDGAGVRRDEKKACARRTRGETLTKLESEFSAAQVTCVPRLTAVPG